MYTVYTGIYIRSSLSSRRAKRAGWPKGLKGPEGTFRPFGPVGALRRRLLHRNGTFVPPAPSTRLRRQVKTDFRRQWAVAGPFFHQSGRFQGVNNQNFGAVAAVNSIFPAARPKRAVSAVFRAPGGPNGGFTSGTSPRRSDAPGKLSAPKVPFSHINIGSLKKKRDSGPFRGSPGRNAFRETAENGQRPLGETALPGRLCTNLKNPKG